ncbi:MAG: uncharacterized protein KVP18_004610 [Porospora cf. gigantea A]|uniref:uncharacterized protein n=1 Tax=Porospora cf. gigantea A TaxID=2853593 RepID=UPI00355A9D05|nr:MAG: hypothetical protein KVP18_004610 [Porospora cf. gigantea A]
MPLGSPYFAFLADVASFLDHAGRCRLRAAMPPGVRGASWLGCWCPVEVGSLSSGAVRFANLLCSQPPSMIYKVRPQRLETSASLFNRVLAAVDASGLKEVRFTDGHDRSYLVSWLSNTQLPGPLPNGVKRVILGPGFFNVDCSMLPPGLDTLELGRFHCSPLTDLPTGLKTLRLGEYYNRPLLSLPPNLETLILGGRFHEQLLLPQNLKCLCTGPRFQLPRSWARINHPDAP